MTAPVRWLRPMAKVWSLTATRRPRASRSATMLLAGGVAVEAVVGRAGEQDVRGFVEDGQAGQVVPLADGKVVGIVRGSDLDRAGAELRVGPLVGDDGDFAVCAAVDAGERHDDVLADERFVALVGGVDGDGGVAEHGLGPRGCDDDGAGAVGERIADVVELALARSSWTTSRSETAVWRTGVPVDDVGAAIDEALLVEADEGLFDRDAEAVVHGEVFAAPVDACAEALHLVEDGAAVVASPLPDALDKGLAAELLPGCAFVGELALHHHLRRDAGVVGSGNPERRLAAHAVPAGEDVHLGLVEHVAHVQAAGDVGRAAGGW